MRTRTTGGLSQARRYTYLAFSSDGQSRNIWQSRNNPHERRSPLYADVPSGFAGTYLCREGGDCGFRRDVSDKSRHVCGVRQTKSRLLHMIPTVHTLCHIQSGSTGDENTLHRLHLHARQRSNVVQNVVQLAPERHEEAEQTMPERLAGVLMFPKLQANLEQPGRQQEGKGNLYEMPAQHQPLRILPA